LKKGDEIVRKNRGGGEKVRIEEGVEGASDREAYTALKKEKRGVQQCKAERGLHRSQAADGKGD